MRARMVLMAAVLTSLSVVQASAYPPRKYVLRDVFRDGKAAFWARVVRAELVEDKKVETVGRLHLRLTECFYGPCPRRDPVKLRYAVSLVEEQTEHMRFVGVGGEALVILKSDGAFDKDGKIDTGGMDVVYFSDPPPAAAIAEQLGRKERRLALGFEAAVQDVSSVTLDELRQWGRERAK